MAWVGSYQETCRDLGIDDTELEFPAGPGRGIAALVDCYTRRVHGLLNTWFSNILEARAWRKHGCVRTPSAAGWKRPRHGEHEGQEQVLQGFPNRKGRGHVMVRLSLQLRATSDVAER